MLFRDLLRKLMKDKGFTVRSLAKAAELSSATVGSYVSGSRLPTLASAITLARALGIDLNALAKCDDFATS